MQSFASHIFTFIHIFAGATGILAGFLAMALRKGSRRHRQVGNVFFGAMMTMALAAALMATTGTNVKAPNVGNTLGGLLVFYMVVTAWLAARHKDGERGPFDAAAFVLVLAIIAGEVAFAFGWGPATHTKEDPPRQVALVFAGIALLAAVMDVRMLVWGVAGAQRVIRHLWRMSFATWMAASSLFLGQPQVFPQWLHQTYVLFLPTLLIPFLVIYWIVKQLRGNRRKGKPIPPVPATAIGN